MKKCLHQFRILPRIRNLNVKREVDDEKIIQLIGATHKTRRQLKKNQDSSSGKNNEQQFLNLVFKRTSYE